MLSRIDTKYSQDNDEPLLELLQDIKITFSEKDPMGFTLNFHFAKNDFFTNSVLTKQVISQPARIISKIDISVRYEVPAGPRGSLQFRGSRNLQMCGLPH